MAALAPVILPSIVTAPAATPPLRCAANAKAPERRQPHAAAAKVNTDNLHFHAVAEHRLAEHAVSLVVHPELVYFGPAVGQFSELDVALGHVSVEAHDHSVVADTDHGAHHRL